MNAPTPMLGAAPRRALHPLVAIATVCVIALCAVAIAAIMGWLPSPKAQQEAAQTAATSAAAPEDANLATPVPADKARGTVAAGTPAARAGAPAAPAGTPASPAACPQCGVVVSVNTVQVPVQNQSEPIVGTVAGGVVGGVVGNQFGGGHGRTALTVLGAVGGALAGREIERNMKQQQTVTRYQLVARTNDGRSHTFRSATPFQYAPGQPIRIENNQLLPQ